MTNQIRLISPEISPEPAGPGSDELPVIDLAALLRVVRTHKATIAGTAALLVALVAIALSYVTPLYSATAYVMLDQRQNLVVDTNAVIAGLPSDPTTIENQVQILRSRGLAGQIVDKLDLQHDSDFNPSPDESSWSQSVVSLLGPMASGNSASNTSTRRKQPDMKNALVTRLLRDLTITSQGRSTAIAINFQSEHPEKAALIANTFAETYVEAQLNAKYDGTKKASEWLAQRLEELSAQTQASARAVEQYKAQNGLTDATNGGSIVQQQLSALNLQLISAQADLAQQEAKYSQVTEMAKSGRAADISQVVSSPLISQLREQETELLRQQAEVSSRYGPLHPKVRDMQSQKQNLSEKINEEVRRVVETVGNDAEVARARVRSLQESLGGLARQTQTQNLARVKLSDLVASAASDRALYDALMNRFKEIEGRDAVQAPDARVISTAVIPTNPSFPNKTIFLGAALPAGILLGFLLALASETLEAGFRTREQVGKYLSLPVLAVLPEIRGRKRYNPADRIMTKPRSLFTEAVRGLQIGLALGRQDAPKIVLVTSAVPSEGKTTVAISLARIAARGGKRVILMDADFRQPALIKTFGMPKAKWGIADILRQRASVTDCLCKDPISEAIVLPAVGRVANPSDLVASRQMADLIHELASTCDLLIIDSSPILPVNDARILAQIADAVVFVVRWKRTTRDAALQAVRALSDVAAPMVGVVMARADPSQLQLLSYRKRDQRDFKRYFKD